MTIRDWPQAERPREKLLSKGAQTLSNAELLAIFLRTGVTGKSAVELGRELLSRFGSLSSLFAAKEDDFCAAKGLGRAKYAQLQAVFELARRALSESITERNALSSPQAVRDFLQLTLRELPYEVFYALFLDAQNRLIAAEEMFRGTLRQTSVYPREVVKRALQHNAGAVIFAHNHPSGVAEPSRTDEILTEALKNTLSLVDVKVHDHLIVAGGTTFSFAERGLL